MSGALAQTVGKKLLKGKFEKMAKGKEDPYFKIVVKDNGKKVQVKKGPDDRPDGISEHDAKILFKVRRRAYRLDNAMTLPILHVKFGVTSLIGLIPVVGDFSDLALGLMVYKTCRKVGLDSTTKRKMIMNIGIDGVVGLTPVLGDIADTFFRCNTRNLRELEKFLEKKGAQNLAELNGGQTEKKRSRRRRDGTVESRPSFPSQREDETTSQRVKTERSDQSRNASSGHPQDRGRRAKRSENEAPVKPPRREGSFF
ncbi:MAG: hypothetical protein LQ351_003302 [Letrouitia transgressa]|nr:MAG: hypothetical protein LQ351_003302 [Letrouitia transgressa]